MPKKTTKKRRVSSSSLSDTEVKSSEEDEDEDRPLASRIMRSGPVSGKRSGKQPPGKKTKQASAGEQTLFNGRVNGTNGHTTKVKTEDKMDEGQLNRLTAGVPVDVLGRSSTGVSLLFVI
jgi:histone acetyltransferase